MATKGSIVDGAYSRLRISGLTDSATPAEVALALDVLEDERMLKEEAGFIHNELHTSTVDYKTLLEDHVLINMPQVIITPHIAFYSQEAEAEIIHTTVANITALVAGSPQNVVGS